MKIKTSLPWRTTLIGKQVQRKAELVEETRDFAKLRQDRIELQDSLIGRWIFGKLDSRVEVIERIEPLDGIPTRVLIYRPKKLTTERPGMLFFHGGGWVLGRPEQTGWLCAKLAANLNITVVAPSYRLAPENRFPAAIDDAWAALIWLERHKKELGITSYAVGGDSAGGNLAAAVALKCRDESQFKIAAQVLVYPAVEMYEVFESEKENADAFVLTSAAMRAFVKLYLGDSYGTEDHLASPIRAEHHKDLPPAIILTAGHDPLLDNGIKYKEVLEESGVEVFWHHEPGTVHGFMSLPGACPQAKSGLKAIESFLAERLEA